MFAYELLFLYFYIYHEHKIIIKSDELQINYILRVSDNRVMFSQSSSIAESFNYPQTSNQLHFNSPEALNRLKNKPKQNNNNELQQQTSHGTKQGDRLYFNIQVIKKVGRFIQNLKEGIVLSKPNLKPTELYYLQSETKTNEHQSLIAYQSMHILLLESLVFVILWVNLWRNTYQLIFSELFKTPILQSITLCLYSLYIYFFFNTEFKNQKLQLISNRKVIIQYYLSERLIYDIVIVLVLILQITPLDDKYQSAFYILRILALVMLMTVTEIGKKLQNIISVSTQAQIIISILGLVFKIFLFLHVLSLAFKSLSQVENRLNIHPTWADTKDLNITTDIEQYIVGWYWGATILSTVGFGDITPVNHVERFFISFIEVMCCIIFGFFVNYIGSLINMVGESKRVYQRDMRKLNRYLSKQSLPDHLKSNIRLHFFNKNKIEQVYDPSSEETIMNQLTSNLTTQITQTRNYSILKMSKFIKPLCEETIRKLSLIAKKMVFAPQQIIFSDKSQSIKLWIIQDGVVEEIPTFINPKQNKPITIYDKDNQSTLGWINFLTSKHYKTLARAKIFTLCYQIKQQEFFAIVKENQQDYNKLQELKQLLIQNNRMYINKCLSCSRFTHNVIQCPRIHFKPRGIYKLLMKQKKEDFVKCRQNRRKNINRSKFKYNWKAVQNWEQHTAQIEDIVMKFNMKEQQSHNSQKRFSVDSMVHILFRKQSTQQQKASEKSRRQSQNISHVSLARNQPKPLISEKAIEFVEKQGISVNANHVHGQENGGLKDKNEVVNYIDRVYLGEANGYMETHNFMEVSKKYILYIINMCTNRNKL